MWQAGIPRGVILLATNKASTSGMMAIKLRDFKNLS